MAGPSRSAEKAEFWRLAFDEHRKSGMSIKAFCAQQGVSEQAFYTWRRKLRGLVDAGSEIGELVPVTVVDRASTAVRRSSQVQIVTPGGFILRVDSSLPTSQLTSLIRSIEDASGKER